MVAGRQRDRQAGRRSTVGYTREKSTAASTRACARAGYASRGDDIRAIKTVKCPKFNVNARASPSGSALLSTSRAARAREDDTRRLAALCAPLGAFRRGWREGGYLYLNTREKCFEVRGYCTRTPVRNDIIVINIAHTVAFASRGRHKATRGQN